MTWTATNSTCSAIAELNACKAKVDEIEVIDMAKKNIGNRFDAFLEEEGVLEDVTVIARD